MIDSFQIFSIILLIENFVVKRPDKVQIPSLGEISQLVNIIFKRQAID